MTKKIFLSSRAGVLTARVVLAKPPIFPVSRPWEKRGLLTTFERG